MFVDIDGVLNVVPDPNEEPPLDAANHVNVPAVAVAPSETEPFPQRLPGLLDAIVGIVFTVATTAVLLFDTQNPLLDSA